MNPITFKTSIFSFLIFFALAPTNNTFADTTSKPTMSAKEYLNSDLDRIFPFLQKMKKEEAAVLISQIREESKKDGLKQTTFTSNFSFGKYQSNRRRTRKIKEFK